MSGVTPTNIGLVGLGKMGVSHLAIANANPRLNVVAVCDSFALLGQMVEKHCGLSYVADYNEMIGRADIQAVIIATPTRSHDAMIRAALDRGLHVFCEKPLTLSAATSAAIAEQATQRGLVAQTGYHNRFVGTFTEAKRLLSLGAIGRVRHLLAEAYGPVVLKPVGKTWRSQSSEGGGCLYDYAAHPINLMNWYAGAPSACLGANLTKQYSSDVEDAVYADLSFPGDVSGQVSVNWSDETMRKMTTRITVWGDGGKIVVDRQELQVYIGKTGKIPEGYGEGWTVKYITELTPTVDYYLRGEEYSAQMDGFADAIQNNRTDCVNDFQSAASTDATLELIRARAAAPPSEIALGTAAPAPPRGWLARLLGR